jgi:hypothetical protein
VILGVRLFRHALSRFSARSLYAPWGAALLVGSLLTLFLLNASPWVPIEVLTTADGTEHIAYVISSDSQWTTILDAERAQVAHLRASSILDRSLCTPPSEYSSPIRAQSLVSVLFDETPPSPYRDCF